MPNNEESNTKVYLLKEYLETQNIEGICEILHIESVEDEEALCKAVDEYLSIDDLNYIIEHDANDGNFIDQIASAMCYSANLEKIKLLVEKSNLIDVNEQNVNELIAYSNNPEFVMHCISNREDIRGNLEDGRGIAYGEEPPISLNVVLASRNRELISQYASQAPLFPSILERYKIKDDELSKYIYSLILEDYELNPESDDKKFSHFMSCSKLLENIDDKEFCKNSLIQMQDDGMFPIKAGENFLESFEKQPDKVQDSILSLYYSSKDFDKFCEIIRNCHGAQARFVENAIIGTDNDLKKWVAENKDDLGISNELAIAFAISSRDRKFIREQIKKNIVKREHSKGLPILIAKIVRNATKEPEENLEETDSIEKDINGFITPQEQKILDIILNRESINHNEANSEELITLPPEMTIGVEIESLGTFGKALGGLGMVGDWIAKGDGSIKGDKTEFGVEIVSPILTGDANQTSTSIINMCEVINYCGNHANESCGGHVHIGANYLTSAQAFANLQVLYSNSEDLLYMISNKAGELPRNGIGRYAHPISQNYEYNEFEINSDEDVKSVGNKLVQFQQDTNYGSGARYQGINFMNLAEGGKGTIEFRLANGTTDAKTWIENINLFGGLIVAAEKLAQVQSKTPNELTDEEKQMLYVFDRLIELGGNSRRMFEIRSQSNFTQEDVNELDEETGKENEKLEALLSLVVPEENRETYRTRYLVNSELLTMHPEIQSAIMDRTASSPVTLKKKDDGKITLSAIKQAAHNHEVDEWDF